MTALRISARTLLACSSLAAGCAFAQDDPLPPENVFRYSARADAERIYIDFDVLEDYYLYRGRFGFESGTGEVALGAARFPRGETHSDEFFGEQEIYRGKFAVSIPYRRSAAVTSLDLNLALQGCAPTFCYLPQDWTATVALPPPAFLGVGSIDTSATGDLLPVDEAFTMNARFDKPNELTVAWQVAPGYYLYRDKLTFSANGPISLGAAALPPGEPHTDDNFGDVRVFRNYIEAKVPFARASPDEVEVEIAAGFQGCKDDSICYPPGEQVMALLLPATSEFPAASTAAPEAGGAGGTELVSTAHGGRCSAASTPPACCCRSRPACCRWCRSCRASSRAKGARLRHSAASRCRCPTCSAWRPPTRRPAPSRRSRASKCRRCSKNRG
jgi:thiol:disulfide interchange protein DsbD